MQSPVYNIKMEDLFERYSIEYIQTLVSATQRALDDNGEGAIALNRKTNTLYPMVITPGTVEPDDILLCVFNMYTSAESITEDKIRRNIYLHNIYNQED